VHVNSSIGSQHEVNCSYVMKHTLVVFLIALSCSFSVSSQATTTQEQELARGLDLKAGITFVQANAIANYYFQHHIAGCGAADPAIDRGSRWEVTPRIGIAGTPSKSPIFIEKHTGQISWKYGPTLYLATIFASQEEKLPQPIHKRPVSWPTDLPREAHSTVIQIEFVVLPSGATSDVIFEHPVRTF